MEHVHVLLLEDDTDIAEGLAYELGASGCEVCAVTSADEGWTVLEKSDPPPAVILLDLMMPGKTSGWDFLAKKREDERLAGIPVIVLTAVPVHLARARSLEGALVLMRKPFSVATLLSLIHRLCPIG